MLARNLFQILITDSEQEPPIPAETAECVRSFQQHHPDFKYHRLGRTDLEALLSAHFDTETLQAFRSLKPHTFKADLGRYCLLLVHGGIYADLVMRFVRPVEMPSDRGMLCFRDTPGTGLWSVSTSLIVSEAGRDELKLAVDLIKSNVATRFYGGNSLCPTGPNLFGRALAMTNRLGEIALGRFEFLTNDLSPYNLGHVDSFGRIVSLRWKTGSFNAVGIVGTNDYNEIWNGRTVYGEDALDPAP